MPTLWYSLRGVLSSLCLGGLVAMPLSILRADLPEEGFPLGRDDLTEIRTVKELRPGVTHIHVERGAWGKDGPPKWAVASAPLIDDVLRASVRECLAGTGFSVQEHVLQPRPEDVPYPMLLAGEFESQEDARAVLTKLSCSDLLHITHPAAVLSWDTGPWALDIVIVDPKQYRGKVIMDRGLGRVSPSRLAQDRGAVVAINASFFDYSLDGIEGVASGIAILQGEWYHEPHSESAGPPVLAIDNDDGGTLSILNEVPPFPVITYAGGKTALLNGIDRMPRGDEIVVMRQDIWGSSFLSHGAPKDVLAVQLGKDGEPYRVSRGIPKSGLFLMASGSAKAVLEEALESGEPIQVDLRVAGHPGLNMLYGAPVLIRGGQPLIESSGITEKTSPRSAYQIHRGRNRRTGRTAIGADAEGKIYLITVYTDGLYDPDEGGRPGSGIGASIGELKAVAQFLGLKDAINLDGGGSTSMAVEGKVARGVIDVQLSKGHGVDRPVGVSILVVDDK